MFENNSGKINPNKNNIKESNLENPLEENQIKSKFQNTCNSNLNSMSCKVSSCKNYRNSKKHEGEKECTHAKNIIFLTGGVCSGVGKGVALSSLAALLQSLGYKVRVRKCDPYLNIDPGTLSPYQHGEVFVTADGVETDLDIGHYERFTDQHTKQTDYVTSGKMYWDILHKEREGKYEGQTLQVVPHLTDHIQNTLLKDTEDVDFLLCEIGGTIGDMEGAPIYEAIRQLSFKVNSMFIHVAYLPYIPSAGEIKTKPVQHSVRTLLSIGIQPDLIICRSHIIPEDDAWKQKIATFANLHKDDIVLGEDVSNTYEMLVMYSKTGLLERVCQFFNIDSSLQDNKRLKQYFDNAAIALNATETVKVAIVGKYTSLEDSYKSIKEAIFYSSTLAGKKLEIAWLSSEDLLDNKEDAWKALKEADGIIIPGGFGLRGAEGMMLAIQYARENNIPLLGICLGFQLIAIEFARNVLKLENAGSSEFDNYDHKIIDLMDELIPGLDKYSLVSKITGFMRLGSYTTHIKPDSSFAKIYSAHTANERFRHRYEMNKKYIEDFTKHGLEIHGMSLFMNEEGVTFAELAGKDNVFIDMLAIPNLKFFVGVQYHPEFLAKPLEGHPLFNAFIDSCIEK